MVKERYVRNMQQARTSNVRQLHSLKLLVSGLDIDKSHFTPELTETVFGKWFYGEAVLFASEESRHCLDNIEEAMHQFHRHFTEIYAIYYGRHAGGLLGLLGLKRSPTRTQTASAQHHYEKMVTLSDRLRQQMNFLKTNLDKMPDETFSELTRLPEKRRISA